MLKFVRQKTTKAQRKALKHFNYIAFNLCLSIEERASFMGVVYKIQNKSNGKIYIGKTKRTLDVRMTEHLYNSRSHCNKSYIDLAIGKYGIDAFDVAVVEECLTEDELNQKEKFWIRQLNCKVPHGYNLTDGGDGVSGKERSLEYRKKMSKANKGKKRSLETRKKMSETWMGHKVSEKTREKISASSKLKRPVICIESKVQFESITAAAKWVGVSMNALSISLRGITQTSGGYHWRYADEEFDENEVLTYPQKKRPVKCVETETFFDSIKQAAIWAKIADSNIIRALKNTSYTSGGYHWVYV